MRVTVNGLPCNTCGAAVHHVPGCMKSTREKLFEQSTIKALTLIQPMGSAIVLGQKHIENRIWAPPLDLLGKYFFIHAGMKYDDEYERLITKLWERPSPHSPRAPIKDTTPVGAIIGGARLVGVVRIDGKERTVVAAEETQPARELVERLFRAHRNWYMPPQWGWILDDTFAIPYPEPHRGMQKLWTPREHIATRVLAQVAKHRL